MGKNSNYYKTQKLKLNLGKTPNVKDLRNSSCDKAQIVNKKFLQLEHYYTKFKSNRTQNSNCERNRNLNCKTTQIVTKLKKLKYQH